MRRLLVVPIVLMFLMAAFVPAAGAAGVTAAPVFMGQGQSDALQLSLPVLNILPAVLGQLGNLSKGITVGHTENTFEGLTPSQSKGLAVGVCALLGNNLLSLPAASGTVPGTLPGLPALPSVGSLPCTGSDQTVSDSTANNGSTTQQCGTNLALAIIDLKTACSDSYSAVDTSGRPIGQNQAGVAELDIALLPNVLSGTGLTQILNTLGLSSLSQLGATNTATTLPIVGGLLNGLLGPITANTLGSALSPTQSNDLLGTVTTALQNVLNGTGNLLTVKLGTGSSILTDNGTASTETTQAAGATIDLIDNLIQVTVGSAQSQVVWNDATGQATASASPALATVTIGGTSLLTGASLLALPTGATSGLLGGLLSSTDQAGDITLLAGTPLQTEIKVAAAQASPPGPSVTASSTGLAVYALEGLGATSPTSYDGGIRLDLASSSAAVAGSIAKVQSEGAALPVTGGPVYVFLAFGVLMAVGAAHLFRNSRKLRRNSNS